MAYAGLGPSFYRKTDGRLPWATRLFFAPCLIGQRLSLWHYRRRCAAWNELTPRIWIGAKLTEAESREIKRRGVTAVLDLTAEFSETPALLDLAYINIQVLDLTELGLAQLQEAVDFVGRESGSGTVYIHCKAGYSEPRPWQAPVFLPPVKRIRRSSSHHAPKARPSIVIRPEARAALEEFATRVRIQRSS